jgi:Uma2 family endonuclease
MSQPAFSALAPLPFDLVYDDGEPLDSGWHVFQFRLLLELISQAMAEQGRSEFYAGGSMFVYYSVEQAREVASGRSYFRGPDIFWVDGVARTPIRKVWLAWEEGGRLPDVIVELLSPSTAKIDRVDKKDLYARVFQTSEYFLYDPEIRKLEGLRLVGTAYQPMIPSGQGRFWSQQLGVFLGLWHGTYDHQEDDWIRLFRPDGTLVPAKDEQTEAERHRAEAERHRAEGERQRAEAEHQRAEKAEAEVARLRALLAERERTGST